MNARVVDAQGLQRMMVDERGRGLVGVMWRLLLSGDG